MRLVTVRFLSMARPARGSPGAVFSMPNPTERIGRIGQRSSGWTHRSPRFSARYRSSNSVRPRVKRNGPSGWPWTSATSAYRTEPGVRKVTRWLVPGSLKRIEFAVDRDILNVR